jgi:hypothetical protein
MRGGRDRGAGNLDAWADQSLAAVAGGLKMAAVRRRHAGTLACGLIAKAGSCSWLHACLSQLGRTLLCSSLRSTLRARASSRLSASRLSIVDTHNRFIAPRLSLPRTHLPSIHSFCVTSRAFYPRGCRQVSSPRLLSRRPPFQHQTALGIVDRASSSSPSRLLTTTSPPRPPYSLSPTSTPNHSHSPTHSLTTTPTTAADRPTHPRPQGLACVDASAYSPPVRHAVNVDRRAPLTNPAHRHHGLHQTRLRPCGGLDAHHGRRRRHADNNNAHQEPHHHTNKNPSSKCHGQHRLLRDRNPAREPRPLRIPVAW